MQKSATSNHFCRLCRAVSWKLLKKSTPSLGGWASSSRKHEPVSELASRACSVASPITPPPPPVSTPTVGPKKSVSFVSKVWMLRPASALSSCAEP